MKLPEMLLAIMLEGLTTKKGLLKKGTKAVVIKNGTEKSGAEHRWKIGERITAVGLCIKNTVVHGELFEDEDGLVQILEPEDFEVEKDEYITKSDF